MTKATTFEWAGWIGLTTTGIALVGAILPVAEDIGTIGGVIAFLCCWVLLSTRNADEFTQALWTSAASLAFTSLLLMMIVWPFLEGVVAGLRGIDDAEPSFAGIIGCAIVAFYIGLFWKRFTGAQLS